MNEIQLFLLDHPTLLFTSRVIEHVARGDVTISTTGQSGGGFDVEWGGGG